MGTRFNLILPGVDDSRGEVLFSSIMEELIRIENMLSCFMPESDISKINNNACNKPVEVNHELLHILTECLGFYERTKGAFDIGIGKIIDHWSEKKQPGNLKN